MSFVARTHPQQGPNEKVDDRETTPEVFAELDRRFGPFTLDVAASAHNAKCDRFYSIENDGLARWWTGTVWCNPPYSNIRPWVEKAWHEWNGPRPTVSSMYWPYDYPVKRIVMLLPANRTEQAWWQDLIEPGRRDGSIEAEFIRGRMRFIAAGDDEIKPNARPPFGVCLVIWGATKERYS